ncbi:MAG TPA: hypothetical protein VKQ32_28340 [Polyangia bacterium]|nr:hypothetical protein [Polyangia bacterium]
MKWVRRAVVVLVVGGAGVFVWWSMQAYACKKLEDRLCAFAADSCDNVRKAFKFGKPTPAACRRGNQAMDGIAGVDTDLQVIMVTKLFSELFGMQKMNEAQHDAMMLMSGIAFDLEKHRSPDADKKKLIAIGPTACMAVLYRLRDGKDSDEMQAILWEVLVGLRGKDLGDDGQPWQDWCNEVIKANRTDAVTSPAQ